MASSPPLDGTPVAREKASRSSDDRAFCTPTTPIDEIRLDTFGVRRYYPVTPPAQGIQPCASPHRVTRGTGAVAAAAAAVEGGQWPPPVPADALAAARAMMVASPPAAPSATDSEAAAADTAHWSHDTASSGPDSGGGCGGSGGGSGARGGDPSSGPASVAADDEASKGGSPAMDGRVAGSDEEPAKEHDYVATPGQEASSAEAEGTAEAGTGDQGTSTAEAANAIARSPTSSRSSSFDRTESRTVEALHATDSATGAERSGGAASPSQPPLDRRKAEDDAGEAGSGGQRFDNTGDDGVSTTSGGLDAAQAARLGSRRHVSDNSAHVSSGSASGRWAAYGSGAGEAVDGGKLPAAAAEAAEEEEEEEEEEPRLKYQRLGCDLTDVLAAGAATCLAVSDKVLALATTAGTVHLLDYEGNQVRVIAAHSSVIHGMSFDLTADHLGTCADDGSVVITGMYSEETTTSKHRYPMKCIALDPRYGQRKTREFVCGGDSGELILHSKGWLGLKETVLHSGEGLIQALEWNTSLIAWANAISVKVYDTSAHQRIFTIRKPTSAKSAPHARPHLYWEADSLLYVGWASTVTVCNPIPCPFGMRLIEVAYPSGTL